MTIRLNNAMRSVRSNAVSADLNGGTLAIYSGSQPADPDDAATGVLLATITLPADAFTEDGSGVITKTGTWTDTVDTTGTAGWARFTGTAGQIDVSVSESGGGGDIILDETALVAGGTVTVTSGSFTDPAS